MAAKLTERFPDSPVSPARIFNWIKRDSDIPPEYIAAIEKIVDGQVTRQQFRPNDFQEIWPDLAGQQAKDAKAKPKTPARQEA